MNTEQHRRKGLRIMGALIGLVKPLLPVMILAVVLGTIGYLCAIFLTVLAGYSLLRLAYMALGIELLPGQADSFLTLEPGVLFAALVILAVLRGVLTPLFLAGSLAFIAGVMAWVCAGTLLPDAFAAARPSAAGGLCAGVVLMTLAVGLV